MAQDSKVAKVETRLEQLRHEYDLYLSGIRRTEPTGMKREVEREVQSLIRDPSSSTMFKFHAKTLAHKFRAFEMQMRNLLDRKWKNAAKRSGAGSTAPEIVVDSMAIDNPKIIATRVRQMLERAGTTAKLPEAMTSESLCEMMVSKARCLVGKDDVKAVRYRLVDAETGAKVKGDLIRVKKEEEPS